jgi:hypothetical protein
MVPYSVLALEGSVPYVAAGWLLTFGLVAGYAAVTLRRGRLLSQKVAPEERRWS